MDEAQRANLRHRMKRRLKTLGALIGLIVPALIAIYFLAPQWLLDADYAWQAHRAGLSKHSVQAGDTRWVYYAGGKGPPLVLLHGYMGDKQTWLPMAHYLAPNFRVIIPDLPGWGESQRIDTADYGYAAQVSRLRSFVQTLHLGGVAIAGHSMGGTMAGLYAAQHPHDVAVLILIDSGGVPFKDNAFTRELKSGTNPFDVQNRADFSRLEQSLFSKPPWLPPRIEDVFVDRARGDRAFDDRVMRAIAAPDQRDILAKALRQVTSPTLAIWCRQDKIIDVSALDAIRAALIDAPKIGVTEFNGCGHMSIIERPRETANAVTRFVLMP